MRQFGPHPTGPIIERDGAYGVIVDTRWRIAVVEVPKGVYLPGGGIEVGETAEEALRREVRELVTPAEPLSSSNALLAPFLWKRSSSPSMVWCS